MSDQLRVIAAAVYLPEGVTVSVPRPARHHHVVHKLHDAGIPQGQFHIQGFLLSDGRFATREEALQIAKDADQILPGEGQHDKLFSEDVW